MTLQEFQTDFRAKIIEKNRRFRLKTQVLLAAIGENLDTSRFYVLYDNIIYTFESIFEAFECAFQVHYVFNLKYQAQSQHFWEFIQFYFYEIELEVGTAQNCIKNHANNIKNFRV